MARKCQNYSSQTNPRHREGRETEHRPSHNSQNTIKQGRIQRGVGGPDPPEKSQNYRVSKQYWSGSPENHKATKPSFIARPSSARQRNAI